MSCVVIMKILLKLIRFVLFTSILGRPEKCDTLDGECVSVYNYDQLEKISADSKNRGDTIKKCECGFEKDRGLCSPNSNKCLSQKGSLDRRNDKDLQRERCAEETENNIYCNFTQKVTPNITTDMTTVTKLSYSEDCTLSTLKLGEITSDETFDTMTHCCGIESSSGNKIYGGTETAIDEYPWLAMLEYELPFLCGGSLISSFYVLTAAHCLVSETLRPRGVKSVRLGEHDTKNDGMDCVDVEGGGLDCTDGAVSITISNTIVHPEYNNVNEFIVQANDIGLLKLSQSSPYTDFIRPICLPSSDITKLGYRFHAAGWGAVNDYQQRSDVKLQVDLPIRDQKVCENLYSLNGKPLIWDKQFCAGGERNKDTCKGDSGGPLIYSDEESKTHQIVGITSFGTLKCGSEGRFSIYTKVIEYVPWIIANTKPSKA